MNKTLKQKHLRNIVYNLIPTDKTNAISRSELQSITNIPLRQLKEIIADLRSTYPICSRETDGGGYWLSYDKKDIEEFVAMIERRIAGHTKLIKMMKSHAEDVVELN